MNNRSSSRGFTLIEMLVVVAIIGTLMAIAVPSLESYLANQRNKSAAMNLITTAMTARAEAMKLGVPIFVKTRTSANAAEVGACTGQPANFFHCGWCVMVSDTETCTQSPAATSTIMRIQNAMAGVRYNVRNGVTVTVATGENWFRINRAGRLDNEVRIEVADINLPTAIRCVTIDVSGSTRTSMGACP